MPIVTTVAPTIPVDAASIIPTKTTPIPKPPLMAIKGGLGIGVVLVGMMLAASTGIVGATVVTMGTLSLPAMIKAGYDQKIATGTICAAGTLGQIIPPSIVLILLASILLSLIHISEPTRR